VSASGNGIDRSGTQLRGWSVRSDLCHTSGKVDLVVQVVIAVPEFLAGNIVTDTKKEGLVLQIGLVNETDRKVEPVVTIVCILLANVVAEFCRNLRSGLPVVQGETSGNSLGKGNVGNGDLTNQRLVVRGEDQ